MKESSKTILICVAFISVIVLGLLSILEKYEKSESVRLASGVTENDVRYGTEFSISEISPSIIIINAGENVKHPFPPIGANPVFAFKKALAEILSSTKYESKEIKTIIPIQAVQKIDIGMGSYTEGLIILLEKNNIFFTSYSLNFELKPDPTTKLFLYSLY